VAEDEVGLVTMSTMTNDSGMMSSKSSNGEFPLLAFLAVVRRHFSQNRSSSGSMVASAYMSSSVAMSSVLKYSCVRDVDARGFVIYGFFSCVHVG
jgi:hypothetical protein